MGCNASQNVSVHQDTFSYIEYEGRGNDYLNYSYYQTYFKNSNDQTLWNDYYRIRNVYETSQQNSETNEASGADDFDQYKHWRDHKKQQGKITSQKEEQYKSKVDMVVENSAAEIIAADEPDCITDGATQLRMGLKTVGTALRITIIKKKEECSQGPAQLKVKVLDTLHFDKPDIDFITRRPTLQPDHKYIDKEFECSKALGKYLDQFQWKRPQEILPDKEICLFHEGTSMADVDQGKFGSCYFLAVLAGLATQPEVMRQIILPDAYDIKNGVFHCRFWKFGQWIDVYVDDYLPCDSNGLVGCQSKDYSGEMWTPLLEKAYAKFMGSYPNMESGIPRDAYVALTGGCAEWLPLTYYKFDLSAVYNRIANALKHASVVVCSSTPTEEKKEQVKERNIVLNHAYTVTATAIVERNGGVRESLVKLRNPWSHKEWTGAWGDKSSEWYTIDRSQRAQLHEIEDNGEFWMSWDDFWNIFTDISICSITPDYDHDGLSDGLDNLVCIYGEWAGKYTGGWENVTDNPTFEFRVPKTAQGPVNILIQCLQKVSNGVYKTSATNILLKHAKSKNVEDEYIGADSLRYSTANPLSRRFTAHAGGKYQIIPSKYLEGETGKFLLRVFSKIPLEIKPVGRRKTKKVLN